MLYHRRRGNLSNRMTIIPPFPPVLSLSMLNCHRYVQVNEELVKNAVGGGGGRAPAAAASKKAKTKTKRLTSSSKAAAAAGRSGKGKMPAAEPPLPPPPPPRHGGYVDSADFNVGTYTAKRAKTRARPGARTCVQCRQRGDLYYVSHHALLYSGWD